MKTRDILWKKLLDWHRSSPFTRFVSVHYSKPDETSGNIVYRIETNTSDDGDKTFLGIAPNPELAEFRALRKALVYIKSQEWKHTRYLRSSRVSPKQ